MVPVANLTEHLDKDNVNLLTCGAQATIPMAHAVSRVTPVVYAEMVSTVASLSAGPGTRHNIDEFTVTTARGLEQVGGAGRGKAIIVLNPADPPIMMRNTVYVVPEEDFDQDEVVRSVEKIVAEVQEYVPGYRLKDEPVFDVKETPWGRKRVVVFAPGGVGRGRLLAQIRRKLGHHDLGGTGCRRAVRPASLGREAGSGMKAPRITDTFLTRRLASDGSSVYEGAGARRGAGAR